MGRLLARPNRETGAGFFGPAAGCSKLSACSIGLGIARFQPKKSQPKKKVGKPTEKMREPKSEVARAGIEPATHGFSIRCSTN